MSTATADEILLANGNRLLRRVGRDGWRSWYEIQTVEHPARIMTEAESGEITYEPATKCIWQYEEKPFACPADVDVLVTLPDGREPIHKELQALSDGGFPDLAERLRSALKVKPPEPPPWLITPGVVKRSQACTRESNGRWWDALQDHLGGSLGIWGRLDKPVVDDVALAEFCPYRFGNDIRAFIAYSTQTGVIRGRHKFPGVRHVVDVATVLSGFGCEPRTFVWTALD